MVSQAVSDGPGVQGTRASQGSGSVSEKERMQTLTVVVAIASVIVIGCIIIVARAAERPENNEGRSYKAKDWFTEP